MPAYPQQKTIIPFVNMAEIHEGVPKMTHGSIFLVTDKEVMPLWLSQISGHNKITSILYIQRDQQTDEQMGDRSTYNRTM